MEMTLFTLLNLYIYSGLDGSLIFKAKKFVFQKKKKCTLQSVTHKNHEKKSHADLYKGKWIKKYKHYKNVVYK